MKKEDLRLLLLHKFKLGNNAAQTTANINKAWRKAHQVKEQYEDGFKSFVVETRVSKMKTVRDGHPFFRMKIWERLSSKTHYRMWGICQRNLVSAFQLCLTIWSKSQKSKSLKNGSYMNSMNINDRMFPLKLIQPIWLHGGSHLRNVVLLNCGLMDRLFWNVIVMIGRSSLNFSLNCLKMIPEVKKRPKKCLSQRVEKEGICVCLSTTLTSRGYNGRCLGYYASRRIFDINIQIMTNPFYRTISCRWMRWCVWRDHSVGPDTEEMVKKSPGLQRLQSLIPFVVRGMSRVGENFVMLLLFIRGDTRCYCLISTG